MADDSNSDEDQTQYGGEDDDVDAVEQTKRRVEGEQSDAGADDQEDDENEEGKEGEEGDESEAENREVSEEEFVESEHQNPDDREG